MHVRRLFSTETPEKRKSRYVPVDWGDRKIDFEVPEGWSDHAATIVGTKYARKKGLNVEPEHDGERSAYQVVHRMVDAWTRWGLELGYFDEESAETYRDEMSAMMLDQVAAPNSPQWFNTGLDSYDISDPASGQWVFDAQGNLSPARDNYSRPQVSACFIQPVGDDLVREGGIFDLVIREARIFKFGSGTGSNVSKIRGKGESLSGGGSSSGLMSFLRVLDTGAGTIQSGGVTRRAAKLVALDVDHPEILQFVTWKAREEDKVVDLVWGSTLLARLLDDVNRLFKSSSLADVDLRLEQAVNDGLPASKAANIRLALTQGLHPSTIQFNTDWQGEAYGSVQGQNGNNSILVSDRFMRAVEEDEEWPLTPRLGGDPIYVPATTIWRDICHSAWTCGDPALLFDDTIQSWHTCPASGAIRSPNPCSEVLFVDNSACNLGSLNLVAFLDPITGIFDIERYLHAIELWTMALDISISMGQYPTREIAKSTWQHRIIGLGVTNLGGLLMRMGIGYGTRHGRAMASALVSTLTAQAYFTSQKLAEELGEFPAYKKNAEAMQRVLHLHEQAHNRAVIKYNELGFFGEGASQYDLVAEQARKIWRTVVSGRPVRNAQVTLSAPTGTISLAMGCDTFGIEPGYSLTLHKTLAGGGEMTLVNQAVPTALARLLQAGRIDPVQASDAEKYVAIHEVVSPDAPQAIREVLATAYDLTPDQHLDMLAAIQPFISGASSKTINLPFDATVDDISSMYVRAWQLGVKAVALYRDGSKMSQPMTRVAPVAQAVPQEPVIPPKKGAPAVREDHAGVTVRYLSKRRQLPDQRKGYTQKATIGEHKIFLHTGEYPDGTLGEIFIDLHKDGSTLRSMMNMFSIAVSVGLQHGVPLEKFVQLFTFQSFPPNGPVQGDAHVKSAESLVDYVFRHLAIQYLGRGDLAHVGGDGPSYPSEADEDLAWDREETSETAKRTLGISSISSPKQPKEDNLFTKPQRYGEGVRAPVITGYLCGTCQRPLLRQGTCLICTTCATTTGCS